jgi:hypothetical protein
MNELREGAGRIHDELDIAEREWNEWVIARLRVGEVLAPDDEVVGPASENLPDRAELPVRSEPAEEAKPRSVVPMWRAGLAWSALSTDNQRILQALAPARSRSAELRGDGCLLRPGPGAREGGGAAVEGEATGRTGVAGRAGAGPVHARAGHGRARRRGMSIHINRQTALSPAGFLPAGRSRRARAREPGQRHTRRLPPPCCRT